LKQKDTLSYIALGKLKTDRILLRIDYYELRIE
jgi:hypothetical protein